MARTDRLPHSLVAIAAMTCVVVASNVLVRYPVDGSIGGLDLADLLTYGAFTYPLAFLVTDLTNRRFGLKSAETVILFGFLIAVVLSSVLATPRIAIASASAFLVGQMLDAVVFDRLRQARGWWRAPLISSIVGSALDTAIFFSLAFAPGFDRLGPGDDFATQSAALLGLMAIEAPRWLSWAVADFSVKLLFALLLLVPYRGLMAILDARARSAVRS